MSSAVDPRIGTELGGYRIEQVIGRGGMGVVYLAVQKRLERRVALKVLPPEYAQDASYRERFERESQMAAAIDHPNILPIYEAGEADGLLFIAMRYVEGQDLRSRLLEWGSLELDALLPILGQVAAALDAAHAKGLVHRDIKPGNILIASGVDPEGADHVYLADFGVAKRAAAGSALTKTGIFVGTLDYAAPEQIEGKKLDGRVDIYALGCVMYHCLTGARPFDKDSEVAVIYAHLSEPPPRLTTARPGSPPELDDVIAKAMAKAPDDRYRTAREFIAAARAARGGQLADTLSVLPPTVPTMTPPVSAPDEAAPGTTFASIADDAADPTVSAPAEPKPATEAASVAEPAVEPTVSGSLEVPAAETDATTPAGAIVEPAVSEQPEPTSVSPGDDPREELLEEPEPFEEPEPLEEPEPPEDSEQPEEPEPPGAAGTAIAEEPEATDPTVGAATVPPMPGPPAPAVRPGRRRPGRRGVGLIVAAVLVAIGGAVGAVLATGGENTAATSNVPVTDESTPPVEAETPAEPAPVPSDPAPAPSEEPAPPGAEEEPPAPSESAGFTVDEYELVRLSRPATRPCEPARPPGPEAAVARIECGLGGPVKVRYLLFASTADRDAYFEGLRPRGVQRGDGACSTRSPAENVYMDRGGAVAGRLLCYSAGGRARLAWTVDTGVVVFAHGTDSRKLAPLLDWWATPGFEQPEPEPEPPAPPAPEPAPSEPAPPAAPPPSVDPICNDPGVDPVIKERAGCPGY